MATINLTRALSTTRKIHSDKNRRMAVVRYWRKGKPDFVGQRLKRDGKPDLFNVKITLKDLRTADFVGDRDLARLLAAPMLSLLKTDVQAWNKWIVEWRNAGIGIAIPNFECADLTGANLTGADLCNVDLGGANLAGANLTGANLCNVALQGANLAGANLTGANLCNVHLEGANLAGANLVGANFYDVGLHDTNLAGANLKEVSIDQVHLNGATFDTLTSARLAGLRVGENCMEWHGWPDYESVNIGRYLEELSRCHAAKEKAKRLQLSLPLR